MNNKHSDEELLNSARILMRTEANEILNAAENLNFEIVKAARIIFNVVFMSCALLVTVQK